MLYLIQSTSKFKTSFNYCSGGGGQNSVIPVVFNSQNNNFAHNLLRYQIAHRSIAFYNKSGLNIEQWRCLLTFDNTGKNRSKPYVGKMMVYSWFSVG